ncbi:MULTISPECIES: ABC transporter substrate-binding protein [unclassified Variovorax]|uniref:ABC transporter substrate-binding protein n=1 Tax=unclassified Variovorax TaxID=663243 RepID=UPI003F45FC56
MNSFRVLIITVSLGLAVPAFAQENSLRIGSGGADIGTLDPHRATTTPEKNLISMLFGGLVRFPLGSADPDKIEGDLAESWQASADGLTWTFKLRRGVQFHRNYGEANAEDVVYSLTRAADAKRSSYSASLDAIKEIKAIAPFTVRIQLKTPVPSLLGLVANHQAGMIVSRRADQELKEGFRLKPVGFGPFEFVEHRAQQEVELKANDKYFRGKPKIARIQFKFFPSDMRRGLAFATGDLDLIYGQREQQWLKQARGWSPPRDQSPVKVDVFGPGEFRLLMLNRNIKPLDDLRVREAVARAVDVQELIRLVGSDVVKAGRSVVPPGYVGEADMGNTFPQDVARARALLREAGHPNGVTLKAVVSNLSTNLPVMKVIREQLKRAGIELEIDGVEHSTYHAQIRKDISALVFYGAARFPIADSWLNEFFHSRAQIGSPTQATNFAHCSVADREIDEARAATDAATRNALWRVAQAKITADLCAIPLFDLQQAWVRRAALDYGVPLEGSLSLIPPISEKTTLMTATTR